MPADVIGFAQFGFAAAMAYAVWTGYRELIPRLLAVIEQNSAALQRVATVLEQHTRAIEELRDRVERIERLHEEGDRAELERALRAGKEAFGGR